MRTAENIIRNRRDAETSVIEIYLDWATRSALKAADTTDPLSRMFHNRNANRDFDTALAALASMNDPAHGGR